MSSLSPKREKALRKLAEKMGVDFHDITLLDMALTHTSYANEKKRLIPSNERLEFLGDAVLELVSSTYLYAQFPAADEGGLTKTRAGLVCSESLAALARELGLGHYLLLGHGEEMNGGRDRQTNLEDAFEAVIGAVYLDRGFSGATEYVLGAMKSALDKVGEGGVLQDYKTELQETVSQHTPESEIVYEQTGEEGPDHNKTFFFSVRIAGKVYGSGAGHSKKDAEQRAAREALDKLNIEYLLQRPLR